MGLFDYLFGSKTASPQTEATFPFEAADAEEQIKVICAAGDVLAESGDHRAAIERYEQALALIPEPKPQHDAFVWVQVAIGDAAFGGGDMKRAGQALRKAMDAGAVGNPFAHLRMGQVYFEKGVLDRAARQLKRAYLTAGESIFEGEEEKYLALVKSQL